MRDTERIPSLRSRACCRDGFASVEQRDMPGVPLRTLPQISRMLPRRETLERPVLVTVLLMVTHSSSGRLSSPAPV